MTQTSVLMTSLRAQALNFLLTLALVGAVTAGLYGIIRLTGLTHGSAVYLIPVLIAGTRWGIPTAVFAAVCGVLASAFFFFEPLYSFQIKDPHEVVNLVVFTFTAVVVGQLANRLKRQLELARQREIDLSDLYAFSRRLAVAFDVSDIQAAIEDHLASVMQRKVVLFGPQRDATSAAGHVGSGIPTPVLDMVDSMASGFDSVPGQAAATGTIVAGDSGDVWLVRAVSASRREFGVIAINLGRASPANQDALRARVDAVLADATATLDRLGISHAISEARMRAQTDQLREALIGSVSHELRTPLASILGAATVLGAAPALKDEKNLKALVQGVHDEALRLNGDIQNLLDASRISSDGVKPHLEWADPADILHSALRRCQRRLSERTLAIDLPQDLPLIHVDAVLVQQALVQIIDNAVKYSQEGTRITISAQAHGDRLLISVRDEGAGLSEAEKATIFGRFVRGERLSATTSGSGLGLWIASAFVTANGGKLNAVSEGPGLGATLTVELPVTQTAVPQLESDADE
jgi:two-component system sensor histidine kinase KdpD